MKNTKQNTNNTEDSFSEPQDEARNERSECSCPQSSGSPFDFPMASEEDVDKIYRLTECMDEDGVFIKEPPEDLKKHFQISSDVCGGSKF